MTPPNVAVLGLGCIGGSFARAIAQHNGGVVTGWTASAEDRELARPILDHTPAGSLEDALSEATLVIIAVPVQAIAEVAALAVRAAPDKAAIIHCGGVQSRESLRLDEAIYGRVIGAHPLAGSHESGFRAARADLFRGCVVSIESRASERVRERMQWLWNLVGADRIEYRSAGEHDAMMVWVSHLPQLASTALAATFAAEHIDPESVGPGARDTTRLAASAFEQWSSLVQAQPAALDAALAKLQGTVGTIREALMRGDERALRELWETGTEWRRATGPVS